ncbi:MAG TPA: pitrilysin family protein [Terriglobales bacterium]
MKIQRQLLTVIFAGVVAIVPFSNRANAQASNWKEVPIPALHTFHPQQPKRIQLPNGMVIFLQEDHELPLIDGTIRIRGGARSEAAAKTGLLDMYAETWRTGGTKTQTGDDLDDYLEARAAKVETDDNFDSTTLGFSCLKGDFDDVFKVFNDLLHNPEFREDKIDLAKKEFDDNISRRNDEPDGIMARFEPQLAYGKDNPYARTQEYATVAAITRQDLLDWHKAHVYPNNIIFGIVGDFDSTAMEAKLRAAYASWAKGPADKAPEIEFTPQKPGYYLAKKTDVNQSNVAMLALGIKRDNPDYFAVVVFNEAFAGGFSSRLFKSVRTAKGLAYGVGGSIGSAFDHPGILRFVTATKSESTLDTINAIYEEMDKLKTDPINDDEIKRAKDAIMNSFVFNYDTPEKVLREQMAYEFYGYPADFLERFRTGIEKVTAADVARVAPKYLHKDQLAVLVVGNPADFPKPLSTLGPVTEEDLTIPPMPGGDDQSSSATASNPEGKALVAKAVQAMGGADKLKLVKSVQEDIALTQKGPQGDMQMTMKATILFPDHMHVALQGPMGDMAYIVSPAGSFAQMQGQTHDIPEARAGEMMKQIKRNLIYIAQHADDPAFNFAANGTQKIGDIDTKIVDIAGPDITIKWFVDPQSGRVVQETYPVLGQTGPATQETDLDNWKTENGLTLPTRNTNKQGGEVSSVSEIQSVELNPTVDPKLFDKRAADTKPAQ